MSLTAKNFATQVPELAEVTERVKIKIDMSYFVSFINIL